MMFYTQIGVHPIPPDAADPNRPPCRLDLVPHSTLRSLPLANDNSFHSHLYYLQLIRNYIPI